MIFQLHLRAPNRHHLETCIKDTFESFEAAKHHLLSVQNHINHDDHGHGYFHATIQNLETGEWVHEEEYEVEL